ncbi:YitT family protein [Streptomyces sp. NPDC059441]|uniref:membrane protein YczE n=1 Tax=Streptomyces sp. NPDC059441 TaxID=3346829 RepID=UPI0036BB322A
MSADTPLPHDRAPEHPAEAAPAPRLPAPLLAYVPLREQPLRRLPQLLIGLALYGFSLSVMVRASLGVNPWSVLYEGLEKHTSLSFGTISAVVGVLVLLLWIPLKQRPKLGTVANIVVLAYASDLGLSLIPEHLGLPARAGLLAGGVLLNGFSIAVYVGARFGPGPRDGLMTGVSGITTRSIRLIRTLIEIIVLAAGWLLGGSVGIGTVLYALTVGTITQFLLPRFAYRGNDAQRERTVRAGVTQRDARRYGTVLRRPPRPELGRHAQGSPGDE